MHLPAHASSRIRFAGGPIGRIASVVQGLRGRGGMGICPKARWTSDAGGAKIGAC
jgi:hypothetical protein